MNTLQDAVYSEAKRLSIGDGDIICRRSAGL